MWLEKRKDSNWSYIINRAHPLVAYFKGLAETHPAEAIDQMLSLIESSVPTKTIFINEAKNEDKYETDKALDTTLIHKTIKSMYDSLINQGKNSLQAKALLKIIEPFNFYEDFIDIL